MVIGFNLDDVLRNTSERLFQYIQKDFPDRQIQQDQIDLANLQNTLGFDSTEAFYEFIENNYLEIFGMAKETQKGAVQDFNNLVEFLEGEGHKVVLVQREAGKVRSATYYFLSDKALNVNNIRFVSTPEQISDIGVDILVAANPKLLNTTVTTVKVWQPYNAAIKCEYGVKTIKELFEIIPEIVGPLSELLK